MNKDCFLPVKAGFVGHPGKPTCLRVRRDMIGQRQSEGIRLVKNRGTPWVVSGVQAVEDRGSILMIRNLRT